MNAVALLRVSTDEQALGLSAQRHDIEVYAASRGITVLAWHEEIISGGTPFLERPVLLAAIADLQVLEADVLIASKWDRLSRDPMTGVMIETEARKSGASVVAADGAGNGNDPAAELFRGMLLLFGQFERRMIGVRTKAAMAVKKARGELVGRPPRGWTSVDGKLVRRDS